ncbi:MAG: sugar ABC transporter permease [Spirochaetes bacterium]|nr:sugar ABC transporter permease [Spirochaetota bacterium]
MPTGKKRHYNPTLTQGRNRSGVLFALPSLVYLALTLVAPLLIALFLSLTDYSPLYSPRPKFIGINNFLRLFRDEQFLIATYNTLVFTLGFLCLCISFSFVVALLIDTGIRGARVFNTAVFLPVIVPISLTSVAFVWILDPDFGIVNYLLKLVGLGSIAAKWLSNPQTVVPSVVGVSIWRYAGISVVMFLSGLQAIPQELSDSARVDGANYFQELFKIRVPHLRETFLIVCVWNITISLKVFTQVKVMTGGGPGTASMVLYLYMYNNLLKYFRMGYASSISLVIAVLVIALTLLSDRLLKAERN